MLDESLALRSVERTIEEVLLAAVSAHAQDGPETAEYGFAWRHATGWLSAQRRLAPAATRPEGIMIFDASVPCELDSLHAQALEVVLRRAGLRTLCLTASVHPTRLGRAVRAVDPAAVVLTGHHAALDRIGRLVYAIRSAAGDVMVFDYRGAVPDTGASTVQRLAQQPLAARDLLLSSLDPAPLRIAARPLAAV